MKTNDFLSQEMEDLYTKFGSKKWLVYHTHYTGRGQGWVPRSPEWGYVGVASLADIAAVEQRYNLEYNLEYKQNLRPARKLYTVIDRIGWNKVTFKLLDDNLTKLEAYDIEGFYRPIRYDYSNQRIWNAKAGGLA